jgi:AraC-like DNA-binding protein
VIREPTPTYARSLAPAPPARAAQLLTTTALPIKRISEQVGYPDALHFSRAFRKVNGQSPSDYSALRTLHRE